MSELAQADPAQAELAVDRSSSATAPATAVAAGLVLGGPLLADSLRNLGHALPYVVAADWDRLSLANGIPIDWSRANASSSVEAVVVIVMSRPRIWSTSS
jgi:hypothetical protein